jgi:hypothetical protein
MPGTGWFNRTVEILRKCASGESTRFVRRLAEHPKELILDITDNILTAAASSGIRFWKNNNRSMNRKVRR